MAEENTAAGAEGGGEEQPKGGGEAAVNALFGDTDPPKDPGDGGDGAGGGEGEGDGDAGAGDGDDTWSAGYVPKAFRGADGKFSGDTDAVFKSWMDGRQQVSRLNAQIAELKSAGSEEVGDERQYVDEFDYDALAEKIPNFAQKGGRDDNPVVESFLKHARAAGISRERAHALANVYFQELGEKAPQHKTPDELRAAAMEFLGPNAKQISKDVQGFLGAQARHTPFTEEQMKVVRTLTHSGPGLSLLYSLSRGRSSTAPPSAAAATKADIEREREKALADLGLPEHEFEKRKDEILARARRLGLDEEDQRTDVKR